MIFRLACENWGFRGDKKSHEKAAKLLMERKGYNNEKNGEHRNKGNSQMLRQDKTSAPKTFERKKEKKSMTLIKEKKKNRREYDKKEINQGGHAIGLGEKKGKGLWMV